MAEWNDLTVIGISLALWMFVLLLIWKIPTFGEVDTWRYKVPMSVLSGPIIYFVTWRMSER